MTDPYAISTPGQLAAAYNAPSELALKKVTDRIDPRTAAFIAGSPFCVLATFGTRGPHCTPRGDAPGFVDVLDETTLALPDRRGNNRLDALRDVLDNPAVALLFLVPGMGETLRIGGHARLTTDPALRRRYTIQEQSPATVMLVEVREVFMQCARAILRSRIWKDGDRSGSMPTGGALLEAQSKGLIDATTYDTVKSPEIGRTLY